MAANFTETSKRFSNRFSREIILKRYPKKTLVNGFLESLDPETLKIQAIITKVSPKEKQALSFDIMSYGHLLKLKTLETGINIGDEFEILGHLYQVLSIDYYELIGAMGLKMIVGRKLY